LFKADIDSACRRVPVLAEHRKHAAVVFKTAEGTVMSEHYALPFGSVGSVYGWDSIGVSLHFDLHFNGTCIAACLCSGYMLRSLARRLLKIPVLRYVDDFYGADRHECAEGALDALARLVRACLGESAIAKHKLEVGMQLVVLGIQVHLDSSGARFTLDPKKGKAWRGMIERALDSGHLCPGFLHCHTMFVQHGMVSLCVCR